MSKVRKSYTSEEKSKIVLDALKGELTQAQITTKYGVHASQINAWKRQFKDGVPDIFRDKRRKDEADNETLIDELYKQIGQQKVEIDFLKKKSALFD